MKGTVERSRRLKIRRLRGVAVLNSAYIKGAGHSGSDLATQNMMFAAFHPGAASLNPEAAKIPKAFAFNSLSLSQDASCSRWWCRVVYAHSSADVSSQVVSRCVFGGSRGRRNVEVDFEVVNSIYSTGNAFAVLAGDAPVPAPTRCFANFGEGLQQAKRRPC